MQHLLNQPLAWLLAHGEESATQEHQSKYDDLIQQRKAGQPIAYIVGHKEFWSLKLMVTEAVLVPRADTETLVEWALDFLPQDRAVDVLDLGTGSGAIALAIAKERPRASVVATDSSQAAIKVARQNQQTHQLNNVEFLLGDWFAALDTQQFDLIASNPPYIGPNDSHLQQGDLRFEPTQALVSSGNGLQDIETIVTSAFLHLKPNGHLLLEHGYQQAQEVKTLLIKAGFVDIVTRRDLNNLERCTSARWQAKKVN